jgi:hypothetical protein
VIDIKRITIPVFLIYAGIIHAIGLALLLPMIVTLPGPGSLITPNQAPATAEMDAVEQDREVTSALAPPPPRPAQTQAATEAVPPPQESDAKVDAPGNIANLLPPTTAPTPQPVETKAPAPQAKSEPKTEDAKHAPTAKKPTGQYVKPSARRSAKKNTKIAPFSGAMSGLFTPGSKKRIFDGRN